MNTNEKELDRLTRGLMRDAIEQPSPSLNARIMGLIMAEKTKAFKYHMRRLPPMGVIFALLLVYILLVLGLLMLYNGAENSPSAFSQVMRRYFPLLLTVGSGISFSYLFAELDKWLKRRAIP